MVSGRADPFISVLPTPDLVYGTREDLNHACASGRFCIFVFYRLFYDLKRTEPDHLPARFLARYAFYPLPLHTYKMAACDPCRRVRRDPFILSARSGHAPLHAVHIDRAVFRILLCRKLCDENKVCQFFHPLQLKDLLCGLSAPARCHVRGHSRV